jgi:hypothetical protein
MTQFTLAAVCRQLAFFSLALCFAAPALGDDEEWRGDIQYLTWDVRADEAEAARAADSDGKVYLRAPDESEGCTWYDSSGSDLRQTSLVSACQGQLICLGQRIDEHARRWYSTCFGRWSGRDAGGAAR